LNYCSNIQKDINGFVFNLLFRIIKKIIQNFKDFSCSLVLFALCAFLLDQLNHWNELVKQGYFYLCRFTGK
jgi:hypothetical protein